MFGIRFIKTQPTVHLIQYRKGQVVREGAGLSFFYYGPTSTLVAVAVGSQEAGFMLELVSSDFQIVTVQGQLSYRVKQPKMTASMLDYSLRADGKTYASEDPKQLGERVVMQAKVIIQQAIQALTLKEALKASASVAATAQAQLAARAEIAALGLEILGVSIVAIKPTPDLARALEAEARESNLKAADDAIYLRRMAAVQNERAVRQNELDTEIAVEEKRRQIQEAQMQAKAAALRHDNLLRKEQMSADIELERERRELVQNQSDNTCKLAQAEAHRVAAVMAAFDKSDPKIVQALAAAGMQPDQLIAQAFGSLALNAERIGQLNVSPDLLSSLLGSSGRAHARGGQAEAQGLT